jgi:sugar/nucleoside kinase (ribokinase family)
MDVHTLSRGMGHHGHRNFRHIENFRLWAECIDIIQVNEFEVKTLSEKSLEEEIALEILQFGTSQIIVTKGDLGARVYYLHKGELNSVFMSALKVKTGNKIGLGDVFGAVYFYNYIISGNLFSSLEKSVIASGFAAEQNSLAKLKNL